MVCTSCVATAVVAHLTGEADPAACMLVLLSNGVQKDTASCGKHHHLLCHSFSWPAPAVLPQLWSPTSQERPTWPHMLTVAALQHDAAGHLHDFVASSLLICQGAMLAAQRHTPSPTGAWPSRRRCWQLVSSKLVGLVSLRWLGPSTAALL